MRNVLAAAAMAGAVMVAASPSMAAAVAIPVVETVPNMFASSPFPSGTGKFDFTFTFTTSVAGVINGGVTSPATKAVTFTTLSLTPLSGGVTFTGMPYSQIGQVGISGTSSGVLPIGTYTAEVTGTASRNSILQAQFQVTPVPLPGTVAMFGAAVMGLGVAGAMRRKSKAAVVSAS